MQEEKREKDERKRSARGREKTGITCTISFVDKILNDLPVENIMLVLL